MLIIARTIPAIIRRFISSFKMTTPSITPITTFRFTTGTTFERVSCSRARKNRIVAIAAAMPPKMLYLILE